MCKTIKSLNDTIGQENAENLVNAVERAQGRAVQRCTPQEVTILLSEKGYVRGINASDNIRGVVPKKYTPE